MSKSYIDKTIVYKSGKNNPPKARLLYGIEALDALKLLESKSIQTVPTGVPLFGMRDYGVEGQIGIERTPEEYTESLTKRLGEEMLRVTRDNGTMWVVIADCYSGSGKGAWNRTDVQKETYVPGMTGRKIRNVTPHLKRKNLISIPWRVALALQGFGVTPFQLFTDWAAELKDAMVRQDWDRVQRVERELRTMKLSSGKWWLRGDIIWSKTNPKPENVPDRPSNSYEHIYLLSKNPDYLFNAETLREQAVEQGKTRVGRAVWTLPTYPYKGKQPATFPPKLVERCILAGSREGDWVLDPFSGSATTGLMALRNNRNYIGIDLNRKYFGEAEARLLELPPPAELEQPSEQIDVLDLFFPDP